MSGLTKFDARECLFPRHKKQTLFKNEHEVGGTKSISRRDAACERQLCRFLLSRNRTMTRGWLSLRVLRDLRQLPYPRCWLREQKGERWGDSALFPPSPDIKAGAQGSEAAGQCQHTHRAVPAVIKQPVPTPLWRISCLKILCQALEPSSCAPMN